MIKKSITIFTVYASLQAYSQTGKVGVAISTPTEIFDVNGTVRVRSLPNNGETNSIYTTGTDTNSGSAPTQTFNGVHPLISDSNGVLGKTTYAELINNSTAPGFDTSNASSAAFVVRRYTLTDTVGGSAGTYNNATGFDTGMDDTIWQAIMSNAMYTINTTATGGGPFEAGASFNYRLKASGNTAGSTWRIIGDIVNVEETAVVDILFIKSKLVAADARTN